MATGKLQERLPNVILEKTIGFQQRCDAKDEPEKSFLESRLPPSDLNEIESKLRKKYNLSSVRGKFKKRLRRKGNPKSQGISNTKKRLLGLYTIERKGLKFKDLIPLHLCWCEYMENMLDLQNLQNSGWTGEVTRPMHEEFTQVVSKADFHGAYLKVSRSRCPSLIGIEGILVFETRNTVKLLGIDNETRCVPKISCEFLLKVGNFQVKIIGKHFMIKPQERATKKLKSGKYFDL